MAVPSIRALARGVAALRLSLPRAVVPRTTSPTTTSQPQPAPSRLPRLLLGSSPPVRRALSTTRTLLKGAAPKGAKGGLVKGKGGKPAGGGGGGRQRASGGRRGKKGQVERLTENQLRVRILRMNLHSPAPPPLRMARNRWLRHWTIHRAWVLYQQQLRSAREQELYRLHQSMHNACEELRTTAGPGTKEVGYLFRRAMMQDGVFRQDGVPIEYARFQTESPAREPWNHGWKR